MSDHPYSALKPENILDAVESLGYQCDGHLSALNSFENRVFQIGIEDSPPLIAKFYRPDRWTSDQIHEEHAFSAELEAAEFPIVTPLRLSDGETLHHFDGFQFALFTRFGGHAPELDKLDTIEVLGRSLGRLHAIGAQKPFIHRPSISFKRYGVDSRDFLLSQGFIPDSLRVAYETLSRDLLRLIEERFDKASYDSIRIHADCHPGNILWRDDRAVFVDFDDCRSGPAVQDIWMLLSGEKSDRLTQLEAFLEGYEMFYDFDDRELNLIESLRTLRMMHYAAWIARRWNDPAFPMAFPWFNTERYWEEHILDLREQYANLQEEPLSRMSGNR